MAMSDSSQCSRCSATGERVTLNRCPICFKMVCESCQATRGGRLFCSPHCADAFFFSDEE